MKKTFIATLLFVLLTIQSVFPQSIHVWEKVEITLTAQNSFANPYTAVDVWVQLKGPGFDKKVWGFWDGGNRFKVRVMATVPGKWTWTSGASVTDAGLTGKTGSFTAIAWTDDEKAVNPNRRGIIKTSPNGHAFVYDDGTPFFLIADTWYAAATWRYPFSGVKVPDDYVPDADSAKWCFEGGVHWLRRHGFNSISIIASFPNWVSDQYSSTVSDDDSVILRNADMWQKAGTTTVKDMHDEDNNRPFFTPGKCKGKTNICANYDRINPAYFQNLDRKFDYLWNNGFVTRMESIRRDHFADWMTYYKWPGSFARYLNYLKARYGTYNFIYSLVHWDYPAQITDTQLKAAFDAYYEKYGGMPFGQPVTAMMEGSTLEHLGNVKDVPYITCYEAGNKARDHRIYASIESFFNSSPPAPGYNDEPYYPYHNVPWGQVREEVVVSNSPRDNYFARAQMYGNFLSGALPGHVYGSGAFGGDTRGELRNSRWPYIWEALRFPSLLQMQHFNNFVLSEGAGFQNLTLASNDLSPRKAIGSFDDGLDGWAYMMRTTDKKIAFLYFENGCALSIKVAGMLPKTDYIARWFNTWTGTWIPMGTGTITTDSLGVFVLPSYPKRSNAVNVNDWAAKLVRSSGLQVQTVKDIEGNVYKTILVGEQTWMAENLRTTKFSNGDEIPEVKDSAAWSNLKTGAYCNYSNTEDKDIIASYGRLYNGFAIYDNRNVCPTGWHVSTDTEWTTLTDSLGGKGVAGNKLKEKGTAHWESPNAGATDEIGFAALPGGHLYPGQSFLFLTMSGNWWSITGNNSGGDSYRSIKCNAIGVYKYHSGNTGGFSVRCVKDSQNGPK